MARDYVLRGRTDRIVRETAEFKRILDLPRRTPAIFGELAPGIDHSALWTEVFRLPGGDQTLFPVQGWALSEIAEQDGGIINIEVGGGKTSVSFLAGAVLGAERPLILLPASALEQKTLKIDLPQAKKNWRVPEGIGFVSYERMSRERQHDFLWRLMPDAIIADECHRLRNQKSAVWRRIERYTEGNPACRFVGLSGTITVKSLRDYEHLFWLALRQGSPLPHRWMELQDWADALDEGISDELRPDAGALWKLCAPGEVPRQGFRRRLQDTPGYVFTESASCRASLVIREKPVLVPTTIVDALRLMRETWNTPGGDTIGSALEFNAHVDELLLGFYYRWVWPENKPDLPWLRSRKAWKSFTRFVIRSSGQHYATHDMFGRIELHGYEFDTEMQVASACAHGRIVAPIYPTRSDPDRDPANIYDDWRYHRERLAGVLSKAYGKRMRDPPREAVWIDRYMVEAAKTWLSETENALLWVDKVAFLEALRTDGVICYGGGEHEVVSETRSCAVSLTAHSEAKNLQKFCKNWFLAIPANSKLAEQVLGRTHRGGQEADEVFAWFSLLCWEWWAALDKARREARYVEDTTGQKQKLNIADLAIVDEVEVVQRAIAEPGDPLWRVDWETPEDNN